MLIFFFFSPLFCQTKTPRHFLDTPLEISHCFFSLLLLTLQSFFVGKPNVFFLSAAGACLPIASVTIYIYYLIESNWIKSQAPLWGLRRSFSLRKTRRLSVMHRDRSQAEECLVCNAHGSMHSTHVHKCMRVILQICPHAQTQTHTYIHTHRHV